MRAAHPYSSDTWLTDCSKIFESHPDPLKLSDFQMTAKLGQGAYGKVVKVKSKNSNQEYAMKIVSKQFIKNLNMIDQIRTEIDIMCVLRHPNIIELLTYFEDNRNIYLIIEIAEESHLYQKLKMRGTFTESEASKIIFDI
jgi:serine/threonine protein kinase